MIKRSWLWTIALCLALALTAPGAEEILIQGAPSDTGYNVGSEATIRAMVSTVLGADLRRFAVFADISYVGTTAVSSVQLDRHSVTRGGRVLAAMYEGAWLIPDEAPTGIYSVTLRIEDREAHKVFARQKIRGFAAYRKLVRIARVSLDRTFYTVGDGIECELALQNLTDSPIKDLRLEFSNANYPGIWAFSSATAAAGDTPNPDLAIKVLRDRLDLPAQSEATIPMMPAGTATLFPAPRRAVGDAGGTEPHDEVLPPEVDSYIVAVWNADRTVLYDMQFTSPVIIRPADRDLPKPYSSDYTHAYNSDIDFTKYREFYPPGMISPSITLDRAHTIYRPGDTVRLKATLKNTGQAAWRDASLHAEFADTEGGPVHSAALASGLALEKGATRAVDADAWTIPATAAPGNYPLKLSLVTADGRTLATTTSDIAINNVPASLMIFSAHEGDETGYAGLIRAAIEAAIPVRIVFFTGGEADGCQRYYAKLCGPNEAREFAMVRMEESVEALEHLGVKRENLIFLGLPEGGSGAIWSRHLQASNPFLSVFLAADHAPYESVLRPNLPYARGPVIDLLKQIISEFHPAMIATPHPDGHDVDQRVANWFTIKACQELLREKRLDPATIVLADRSPGASKPAPYKYDSVTYYLSGEAAALRQEMRWIYQSQDGNRAEAMRRPLAELPRQEQHLRIVDWQQYEGWNE